MDDDLVRIGRYVSTICRKAGITVEVNEDGYYLAPRWARYYYYYGRETCSTEEEIIKELRAMNENEEYRAERLTEMRLQEGPLVIQPPHCRHDGETDAEFSARRSLPLNPRRVKD